MSPERSWCNSVFPCVRATSAGPTVRRPSRELLKLQDGPPDGAHTLPFVQGEVKGFGVLQRIGQGRTLVMFEMCFAIDGEGHPKPQRQPSDRGVDPIGAGRVSMHGFVLQRAIPAHQPSTCRQQQPPRQRRRMVGQHEPASIDHESHEPGGQSPSMPWGRGQVHRLDETGFHGARADILSDLRLGSRNHLDRFPDYHSGLIPQGLTPIAQHGAEVAQRGNCNILSQIDAIIQFC